MGGAYPSKYCSARHVSDDFKFENIPLPRLLANLAEARGLGPRVLNIAAVGAPGVGKSATLSHLLSVPWGQNTEYFHDAPIPSTENSVTLVPTSKELYPSNCRCRVDNLCAIRLWDTVGVDRDFSDAQVAEDLEKIVRGDLPKAQGSPTDRKIHHVLFFLTAQDIMCPVFHATQIGGKILRQLVKVCRQTADGKRAEIGITYVVTKCDALNSFKAWGPSCLGWQRTARHPPFDVFVPLLSRTLEGILPHRDDLFLVGFIGHWDPLLKNDCDDALKLRDQDLPHPKDPNKDGGLSEAPDGRVATLYALLIHMFKKAALASKNIQDSLQ